MKDILQDTTKQKVKELVNELLENIRDITHKYEEELEDDNSEEMDIKKVIGNIQNKISNIVEKYVPDFIKGTMKFLARIDNNVSNSEASGKSIIILIIEKILKEQYHILIKDSKNISKLLNFYFTKIASDDNELIDFIVKEFSKVLKESTISFNITNDFYDIINKFIAKLLTNDSKTIDINLIFTTLIPKLLNVLSKSIDTKNESGLLEFINGIFTEMENMDKFIYYFIDGSRNNAETKNIYLSKENDKKTHNNSRKINFPKLELNLKTIIDSIFKISDIQNLLNQFLLLFIKPIAALLEAQKEEAKKALFRITAIYTYFYYKYAPNLGNIVDTLLSFVNPFEPDSVLKKLIETEIKSKAIKLDDIWGDKTSGWLSTSYDIFDLAKNAARETDDKKTTKREELKDALKKGILNKKTLTKNS